MASGEEKPWKTQSERKAYFTGIEKAKAAYAAKNRSSYVQGNWQSTGPSLPTQTWPLPTHAYPPGQFQPYYTNQGQAWPSPTPTHLMGQVWPGQPPCHPTEPQPTGQAWPPMQTAFQPTMQSQPPYLSQEQAIHEFHRLHQYNTEQGFNQLRSLLMMQPVVPSEHIHPVNQMHNYPPQFQHYPAAGPYVPSYPPQYHHYPAAGPYVPSYPPSSMEQPYNVGQPPGGFENIPEFQHSQTSASSSLFKPSSVRCQEVDDSSPSASSVVESSDGKPSESPASSVSSPYTTIGKIREPDLKRKASTEMVETSKKTKVDPKAEAEGPTEQLEPTANGKDPTEMDTKLGRPQETSLALPRTYQSPSVDDASEGQTLPDVATVQIPNYDGPSQHSCKCPIKIAIGDANAPTKSKADAITPDPSKTPPIAILRPAPKVADHDQALTQLHSIIGTENFDAATELEVTTPTLGSPKTSHRTTLHQGTKSRVTKTLHQGMKSRGTKTSHRATLHQGTKSRGTKTSHRATLHQGTKSRMTRGDPESSSTVVDQQMLAEFGDALETSSQASTTCLSPELPYRSLPFKASESVCKNKRDLPGSLLHSSLDDLPDLDISARDTPPPNSPRDSSFSHEVPDALPNSLGKNNTRNQQIAFHERLAAPEKRTFRMLLELESTLKVAQEVPMPRAKPKYDSCYHIALPDLEDGDVTAVNQDSSEDSEYMNDSGDDEDEGSITLDNLAEYSDDEELDNDEVKPRSRDLTPNTTAGKASAKAKAQSVYVFIKREAEK